MCWREHTASNRRAWDEIAQRRARWREKQGLSAEFFADGGVDLPEPVRDVLGDVDGRRCLHLQCATGEQSLSLAVLGATVTAVDISGEQIAIAREKAMASGLDVDFVAADVLDLPGRLRSADFDLVYTATGVMVWIPDLRRWAFAIAAALRPGGRLVLFEEHPVSVCLQGDEEAIRVEADYFSRAQPLVSAGWRHFPGAEDARSEKVEFIWPLGDVVTCLIEAGLQIDRLVEFPAGAAWRFGVQSASARRLPGTFLLTATQRMS